MNDNVKNLKLVKQPIAQILSERNTEAIRLALIAMEAQLAEAKQLIMSQRGTIQMLVQDVAHLKQMEQLRKINMTGLGPSVKE